MDASENTLKRQIIQLLCSGELLFGVNYEQQIIDLSNYCDLSFNDIRAEIAAIVVNAPVTREELSTMSTGIGLSIQPLYDDRVLRSDLSSLSTQLGYAIGANAFVANSAILGLSTLSTTIGTQSNLFTSFSSITLAGLSSLSTPIGSSLVALNNLTFQTYAGLSSLSTSVGTLSNLFTDFSSITLAGLSSLSTPIGIMSTTISSMSNYFVSVNSSLLLTTQVGLSTLSIATGNLSNLFTGFSSITQAGLSSLSTVIGSTNSTLFAFMSTTRAGLSSLSSQIGLALFAIPSTVSTRTLIASSIYSDELYTSTLWVLSDARVYGTLRVGTGTTTIDDSTVTTSLINVSTLRNSQAFISSAFISALTVSSLVSRDLSATASTLSTGIGNSASTINARISALQPVSTLRDFRASNLYSVNFSAGNRPYWLLTGAGAGSLSTLARSFDGSNWENIANGNPTRANKAVWNGDHWLLCGAGDGAGNSTLQRSVDGVNWSSIPIGLNPVNSATWNGSLWLLAGVGTQGRTMAKSTDGISWTSLTTPFWEIAYGSIWTGSEWIAYGRSAIVEGPPAAKYMTSSLAYYNPQTDAFRTQPVSSLRISATDYTSSIVDMDFNATSRVMIAIGDVNTVYVSSATTVGWKDSNVRNLTNPATTTVTGISTVKINNNIAIIGGGDFGNNNNYIYNTNINNLLTNLWTVGQIPLSSVNALYYNSNDNYWIATGSNLANSTTAISVDGVNWTRTGSNLRIGTGITWSGQANCNVARVWGQLDANSIVAASSIATSNLLTGSLVTLQGNFSSINVDFISSGYLASAFSSLSSFTGSTLVFAQAGLSTLSSAISTNYSTLFGYISSSTDLTKAGLSSLSIATAVGYQSVSTVSTVYGYAVSTLSAGVFANRTGLSTLSTTIGSNYSTLTSSILSTLGIISTFSNATSTQFSTISSVIFTNFLTTQQGLSSLSSAIGGNFSTLSSYIDTNTKGLSTLSSLTWQNFSSLSTGVGKRIDAIEGQNYSNVIQAGLSSLSTPLGSNISTTNNILLALSTVFSTAIGANFSTLTSSINGKTLAIPSTLLVSTLIASSTVSTSLLNASSLTLLTGSATIRTISAMSAQLSSIRVSTEAQISTLRVNDICYASTFIGSFAFTIQVF